MKKQGSVTGSAESDEWAVAVAKALSHPLRIAILRDLAVGREVSPAEFAASASARLGTCAYHMRELRELGMLWVKRTRPARGAVEHFYELTSEGRAVVRTLDAIAALAPAGYRTRGRRAGRDV